MSLEHPNAAGTRIETRRAQETLLVCTNPRELIRVGDYAIAREDDAALRSYFVEDYAFRGPVSDLNFDELGAYFAALPAAFSDLRIVREQIIVDANFLAALTRSSTLARRSHP